MGHAVSSLGNALQILNLLDRQNPVLRVGEVGRSLDLPKSSVSRLLKTMAENGLLAREVNGMGYVAGPLARKLGELSLTRRGLLDLVENAAERLIQEFGFVCYIGMIADSQLLIIRRRHGSHPALLMWDVGQRAPLLQSAGGWVLLSRLPESEALDIVALHGGDGAPSPNRLSQKLARVRREGGCFVTNAATRGVATAATAVCDPSRNEFLAISLAYPIADVDAEIRSRISLRIREEAAEIGKQLGDDYWAEFHFANVDIDHEIRDI